MGTISSDLIKFKTDVGSKLDSINSVKDSIKEALTNYDNYNNTFKTGIDGYLNSQSKDSLMTNMTEISKSSTDIQNSLDSFLGVVISKSKEVIGLISNMEEINTKISALNTEDANYNSNLNSLNVEFDKKEEEAKKLINEMKKMTHNLKVPEKPADIALETPTGGKISKFRFTAKDGTQMDYYLYLPQGIDPTKKLPMHIYLHGFGERGNGALNHSLPKMLNEGYAPPGIVLIPQLPSKSPTSFTLKHFQQAIIEMSNKIAQEHNVDTKRISLSGHSNGAIGGYELIQNYPGYFSAFIPISGSRMRTSNAAAMERLKIFAFHGTNDSRIPYDKGLWAFNGATGNNNGSFHTFQGGNHSIQNSIFNNKYSFNGAPAEYPLLWAFQQVSA